MILCPRNIASDLMKVSGTGSIPRSNLDARLRSTCPSLLKTLRSPGPKVSNPVIGVPGYAQMDQAKEKESPIVFQRYD